MQRLKTSIIVKTAFEGFHKYENAPEEVSFLRNLHRHVFNVVTKIQVYSEDRELEYFMVKRFIDKIITEEKAEWGEKASCEKMARIILERLNKEYGKRNYTVSVFEDNENGSEIEVNA